MDAGEGDLERLVGDLLDGRLTQPAPHDYLLLLQEAVVNDRERAFVRSRALHEFVVPVYEIDGRLRSVAILSTLPLSETRALTLPRARQPRMAAIGAITVGGAPLFVASTHFENRVSWWRGGFFSDAARGRQAEALIAALPSGDGLLGGDFNTWLGPRERAWSLLTTRFADTPPLLPPTFHDRLVLDHLFYDLPSGWRGTAQVLEDRYGSDHHPVLGVITSASARR